MHNLSGDAMLTATVINTFDHTGIHIGIVLLKKSKGEIDMDMVLYTSRSMDTLVNSYTNTETHKPSQKAFLIRLDQI